MWGQNPHHRYDCKMLSEIFASRVAKTTSIMAPVQRTLLETILSMHDDASKPTDDSIFPLVLDPLLFSSHRTNTC